MSEYNHIKIEGYTQSFPYTTKSKVIPKIREISEIEFHAIKLKNEFEQAVQQFNSLNHEFVFLQIDSAVGFDLDIKKFETGKKKVSTGQIIEQEDGDKIQRLIMYLNKEEIQLFLEKIEEFKTERTAGKKNPKNLPLFANIDKIEAATLKSFWNDRIQDFPSDGDVVWWEAWVDRDENEEELNPNLVSSLANQNIQIGDNLLRFPEHFVFLMKGSLEQLKNSILYFEGFSELRKPLETADFFTNLSSEWQESFLDDLHNRIIKNESDISVCLLDTGITKTNQILESLVPDLNMSSHKPEWENHDSMRSGHGTQMASIILLGDLTDAFQNSNNIHIYHHLESVKIIDSKDINKPDLYGSITIESISSATIMNPYNKRIVCLAITSNDINHNGRPSSWSSAIDKLLYDEVTIDKGNTLMVISGGNLMYDDRSLYPISNEDNSIEDPAQSFNAITIGAYTEKTKIDFSQYPNAELLAKSGQLSPSSKTSFNWDTNEWARKPDVIFEGGNDAVENSTVLDIESLKLLAIQPVDFNNNQLSTFGDTSAATALAAKFLAELYYQYPNYWPETIRALTIHSADWHENMLSNKQLSDFSSVEKRKLTSIVGYGIPNLKKAKYSAENSLSLVMENELTPFRYDKTVKTKDFHLIELPWPTEALFELAEKEVKLTVTLSYYIEPNPGNKRYAKANSYRSFGLRFQLIGPLQSDENFKAQISKNFVDENYQNESSEKWVLGNTVRDKGSIHKDIWIGSAADLATRNKLAIYPTSGWWKDRKKLSRYNNEIRYSLIVSIDSDNQEVDLYNEVLNKISIDVEI